MIKFFDLIIIDKFFDLWINLFLIFVCKSLNLLTFANIQILRNLTTISIMKSRRRNYLTMMIFSRTCMKIIFNFQKKLFWNMRKLRWLELLKLIEWLLLKVSKIKNVRFKNIRNFFFFFLNARIWLKSKRDDLLTMI